MAMTSIEKIEASQNSIHIYLREGGTVPGRYTVLERAPYETEEALSLIHISEPTRRS